MSPGYNHDYIYLLESSTPRIEHSTIKPYRSEQFKIIEDSLSRRFIGDSTNALKNALLNNALLEMHDKKSSWWVNPILDLNITIERNAQDAIWFNQRGIQFCLNLDKKIRVESRIIESYFQLPSYMYDYAMQSEVVPELGRYKHYGQKNIFDITNAMGWVEYKAAPYFRIELGHDKHFWGEGYRSLFLSDVGFYYPYVKLTTDVGRIKYVNLYSSHQDINFKIPESEIFGRKFSASHILSIAINKKLELGVFESVIWGDSLNHRKFDLNYINPVILYRPIEYSVGSYGGNAMLGLFATYIFKDKNKLYTQFLLDDLKFNEWKKFNGWWKNKYAFQLGIKIYDLLIEGLGYQLEANYVRPYTYSHFSGIMNYGHFNQSLAHPYGANFIEALNIFRYQKGRYIGKLHYSYTMVGLDNEGENWGQNIYNPYTNYEREYENYPGQGLKTNVHYFNMELAYLVNPTMNFQIYLGTSIRDLSNVEQQSNTGLFYLGVRTNGLNKYRDFF
jgi:hypothetical protein